MKLPNSSNPKGHEATSVVQCELIQHISLMGKSAVLVVYFPGKNQPHQLLLLDSIPAWDLVFETPTAFNHWAEERYGWIVSALRTICRPVEQSIIEQGINLQPALVET